MYLFFCLRSKWNKRLLDKPQKEEKWKKKSLYSILFFANALLEKQHCGTARSLSSIFLLTPKNYSVSDFISWGSKITADGDCSHEIKRRLILGRKVMSNLNSIFKSRDITLPKKVHLLKAMVFPAVMYGCESWTVKKAERRGIGAFELWCWRRLLRVPWTARRSNHSILKEISPGCSLEELMLKLKLQYFGHLMWRVDSLEKTLMLGGGLGAVGEGDDRGWNGWMASPTQWRWVWVNSGSWWWTGRPGVLRFMGSQRVRHDWATELKNYST